MFRAFPCQVLQEIYERIPCSTEAQLVFRGLHYDTREQVDAHVERIILNGFTEPESFSTRIQIAREFVVCSSNVYAIGLRRDEYTRNEASQLHAMLICDGYKPKDCGRLNAERKEEAEVWLQDTSAYCW